MTDVISYDVKITPSPTVIDVTVAVTGVAVSATVTTVPELNVSLSPSGNFAEKIVSGVLDPIAELIVSEYKDKPKDLLQGKVIQIGNVPSYDVEGISIVPSALVLGSASPAGTPMVKATGTLTIATPTPAPPPPSA